MNKRLHAGLALLASMLLLTGCPNKQPSVPPITYVQVEYANFFRVSSLNVRYYGNAAIELMPTLSAAENVSEIKTFYGDAIIYNGRQYYAVLQFMAREEYSPISMLAIDWRVTDIDIITQSPWDSNHPAGTSVKDFFSLKCLVSDKVVTIPLSDFKYGDWMLTDILNIHSFENSDVYYPYNGVSSFAPMLVLSETAGNFSLRDIQLKVQIKDAFGNVFDCNVE